MNEDPFKEYLQQKDPDKREKAYAWGIAIGLQDVDGLKTSDYLVETAIRNIEGEISMEEAIAIIENHYNENRPLHNRALHVSGAFKASKKANIESQKANIEDKKANIGRSFGRVTAANVCKLIDEFGFSSVFGRSDVMKTLGIKATRATELITQMYQKNLIYPASGFGKGKYRFKH